MQLHLPNFLNKSLVRLTACAYLDSPNSECEIETLYAKSDYKGESVEATFVVQLNSVDNDSVHIHVDVVQKEHLPPPPSDYEEWDDVEELKSRVEKVISDHGCVYYDGFFELPKESLPRGCMIHSLLDISTPMSGAELDLTGTTFAIHNDDFLTNIKWSYDKEEDTIKVTLSGEHHMAENLNGNYLNNAVKLLEDGIDRLVFEKTSSLKSKGDELDSATKDSQAKA